MTASQQGEGRVPTNRVLEEIYETGWVHGTSGKPPRLASESGMPRHGGERLYELVKQEAPGITLEVGFAVGLSTLFICQALREVGGTRHVAIDPNQSDGFDGLGIENIAAAGFTDLVDFYEESSHRVLPRLEGEGLRVDLAFIDGGHLFDYTLLEFFYIDRMLRPGGLIVFDDSALPAVAKVVRFAVTNRGYADESCTPWTGPVRESGRRLRRLARGLASLPGALAFAVGSERCEMVAAELLWPRQHGMSVLRKRLHDDRDWLFYRTF